LSESQAAAALRRETAAFHSLPEEQFVSAWAELAEHYFNRHLAGEFTFAEQRRRRVQAVGEHCGVVISDDACVQIFSVFLKAYEDNWTLYPEVPNCLAALIERGAALGLITNGEAKQQRSKLRKLGLYERLGVVVISAEHKVAKPDRRIFEIAAKMAALPAERCWYIGDRLDVDAEASRDAGFNAIWVNRAGLLQEPPSGIEVVPDLTPERLCKVVRLSSFA
jgi:putative hydrolase of the HAD superfamily